MPTLEALLIEYKGDGRDNSDSIDGCIYAGSVCGNHAGSVSCGDLKFDQCFITLLLSKTEIPPTGWMDSWRYFWPAKEVKVMWKNRGGGQFNGFRPNTISVYDYLNRRAASWRRCAYLEMDRPRNWPRER